MKRIILLIMVIFGISTVSCARKEVKSVKGPFVLKLGYQKGSNYLYNTDMRMQNTIEMSGASHTMNVLSGIKYDISVEDIRDDTMDIQITIKDVNITLKTVAGSRQLPEANMLSGKRINITVLKNGNIIKKGTLNMEDNNLKNILENMSEIFNFIPDVPVRINSTWKDSTDEGIRYFKLLDVKVKDGDTVAVIGLKGSFNKIETSKSQGMNVKTEIKGSGEGKIYFSITKGIILKENVNAGLEGKVKMESGTEMPMYIDQDIETKLLKED